MDEKHKAIHDERQQTYGKWRLNMAGTSQQLSGMLTQMLATGAARYENGKMTLPDWAAPLFMKAIKSNRMASGYFKQDNYDDDAIYGDFVAVMQREAAENAPDYGG
jgi:hypothetical protein